MTSGCVACEPHVDEIAGELMYAVRSTLVRRTLRQRRPELLKLSAHVVGTLVEFVTRNVTDFAALDVPTLNPWRAS